MEAIYEVSSSEKVRSLEEDLRKELKELQNEVEEGNFMSSSVAPKTSGSVPLPKDADHFRRERKLAIEKSLQVREAQPLIIQSDVMYEEMSSCSQGEYSGKSIPLLLHQFFVERIEHLVQCKHMHMLRWARFCEHTKAIENLFPLYQKRLSYIMEEYHDCIQRARRLAVAFEATLAGSDSAMSVVTMEDLLIYTRWLICMLHSVKRINAFVRQIEWLPSTHKSSIQPQITDKEEKLPEQERKKSVGPPSKARGQLKKILSQVSITAHLHVLRPTTVPDADLPPPPPLSLSPYQLVSEINPSFAAAVAASGGGLASDEINLKLPLHETSLVAIKSMLEFLMTCYAVEMDINQINTHADEMDLFTMVSRRFKKVFSKQEQMRTFPIYDASIEEFGDSKIRSEGALHTFKQHSNWISFNPFRPEQTVTQVKAMTKLKQTANIDELLKAHSRFIHVQDGQRVLSSLKEHAKAILEPPKPQSASVTTYRTQNDTAGVWKRIFSYASVSLSSKDDVLEFDTKISEDDMGGSSNTTGEFDLGTAVELLGLDDEDAKTQASKLQGAYMSFLLLRHLRLRDLQRSCLGILNYFQSTERTLVINDCGLSLEGGKLKTSTHQVFHGGGISGIGSHQYVHNTPADYRVEQSEFMEFSEVENHDDFFTMEEGRVHIQDQRGYYILYDSALADFKQLETELLLVATHYIEKDLDFRLPRISGFQGDRIDLGAYGHQKVDRFAVLLDLWTNEAAYLENKRQLVDCYLEAYHHVFDPKEKRRLAQVIVNVIHSRPRFDFSADYFVKIYRAECVCLRLHANLIKSILDAQVDDEREFVQKVSREDNSALFGLPYRIIPQQHIAVNTSRPALNYIYMLEFHPSLGLASRVYEALQNALKVFIQLHKPKCTGEIISLEHRLFEAVQKEWDNQEPSGHSFAQQTQKDLFSEVFVEDPIFLCEVAQSLVNQAAESKKGGRKSVKEKQKILTDVWSNLLEVVTLRHRLITAAQETDVVTKAYKRRAKEIGFDEYHAFLRAVSFDFAQAKPEAEMQSVLITLVTEDDSRVDRYTPAYTPLAIQELDEKHLGAFSFRNREGFRQIVSGAGVQKLQTILMAQIVHKNLIISSVLQLDGCSKVLSDAKANAVENEKRAGLSPRSSHDTSFASRASSAEGTSSHLTAFSNKRLDREFERKLQEVFVSIQLEKTFLRDKMLNDYIHKKEQMGTVMKNIDEVIKLKRKLVTDFCENLHKRVSQYSLQSQIIAYFASLVNLMADFPTTRDSHFVIGEEDEKKNEEDDKITSDPKQFTPRPRRLLSTDGRSLLNLWFIPHYTEILKMYPHLKGDDRNSALRVTLQLISSLHDICQYLCAHARLGSSHARLGSQKLEFSGVTADWGGTEGIGAELREIQRQINHLENPVDPHEVADFLTKRRDNMFLEFDISISHSVRDTFLSTGNEAAYKSITQNMQFALKNLSNLPRPSIYGAFLSVPEPLEASDEVTKSLFPWRSFLDRYGPFPMMYWPWDLIGENMQLCLAGLRDVDRHVVNGEILGVSLLLEDVLQNGLTDIFTQQPDEPVIVGSRSRPGTSMSRRPSSRHGEKSDSIEDDEFETAVPVETRPFADIPKGPVSLSINPQAAVKLINLFLLVCSRLELLKTDWGCRKLGVNEISTSRLYRTFCKIYKIEILQPVYQQVAVKLGLGQEYAALGALVSDDERLSSPPGSTEMELKVKQVIRLLENLECTMIYDVIKRISREHTLVVSERGRDDATLPTDLWKKPAMKENCTISKPHLVENFLQYLMSEHTEKDDRLTFTKEHLDNCLVKLASETMLRERNCFESYAMYYENLLRHQHQLLYIKEQEIKQHLDTIEANSSATIVDVHCQLADRSHEQLLEITALRAKIAEMRESLMNQEKDLRERIKTDFASLVQELFSNCFSMKNRFEEFRLLLHDDVHEGLDDVRRKAVEDMKKLREKSGTLKEESEAASRQVLAKAEQIRGLQEENKHLGQLFLKIKTMNNWKRTRLFIRYHDSVESLREEADKAKRECLEVKKIAEEKEILFKQEQAALRKALSEVERECQKLRKKLQCEQKTKLQKMHAQMQEANSMRQLELAKSTNIDKLISDLEEKELQLRLLTQNLDRDQRRNLFAQEQSKKALKHMMLQLDHERHLKLDAFERVEDLQRQIYEYEQNLISGLSRPGSGAGSRPASRTDKRPLSSYKTAPEAYAASPAFIPSLGTRPTKPINVVNPLGGGIWPPTVLFPQRQATTPDPGVSLAYSPPPKIQRPKTHGGRLRGKISESLLGDLETDDVPDARLPPTAYGN